MAIRVLLQTTLLPTDTDDWVISTFSLLTDYLTSLTDDQGQPLCEVTARDRHPDANGNDPVLSTLDRKDFDELWLFALDVGGGLSAKDCSGIVHFHQQGGGILSTRDHEDMGISMCALNQIGCFHYFNSRQLDPDESRRCRDDADTATISWPNYHSGSNGDYQLITPVQPIHPLLRRDDGSVIQHFPAHPHEGGVGIPGGMEQAQTVAMGTSKTTQRMFNLAIAADHPLDANGQSLGRIVAQSTFHHFVDYNWDISKGCPSFVEEPPSTGMAENPQALADIQAYVKNLVIWLAH